MYIRRPIRRLILLAIPVAAVVLGLVALPPASPSSAADPKVVVTPLSTDRRSITITMHARVTYPADTFSTGIDVSSGTSLPDEVESKVNGVLERVQSLLQEASLPAAEPDAPDTAQIDPDISPGKVVAMRHFHVNVDSWADAERVRQVLSPIRNGSNTISDHAVVRDAYPRGASAKFTADPTAVRNEARRKALLQALDEANSAADVFNMRAGQPLSIPEINITEIGGGVSKFQGYLASGTIVFELVDK